MGGSQKTIGLSALTFGCGILLCTVLPSVVLACVEAAAIVGGGVVLFLT